MAKELLKDVIKELDESINYSLNDLCNLIEKKYYEKYISDEKTFCVFTDGSCLNNGKKNATAGYAIIWPYLEQLNYSSKLKGHATNNRAEYSAIIKALEVAAIYDPNYMKKLYIYTDSELLINSITKWMDKWKKNGWKTANKKDVLNKDLLLQIDDLLKLRNVEFKHVEAHTDKNDWVSIWNDKVDKAAKKTIVPNILSQFT